jgi:hypothetical protein
MKMASMRVEVRGFEHTAASEWCVCSRLRRTLIIANGINPDLSRAFAVEN